MAGEARKARSVKLCAAGATLVALGVVGLLGSDADPSFSRRAQALRRDSPKDSDECVACIQQIHETREQEHEAKSNEREACREAARTCQDNCGDNKECVKEYARARARCGERLHMRYVLRRLFRRVHARDPALARDLPAAGAN